MSESNARYRTCIILMVIGLQLTVLGVVGLTAEVAVLLTLVYIGPILTFSAAAYAVSAVSSASKSSQYS